MKKGYILATIGILVGLALYMGKSQGMQKGRTSAQTQRDRNFEQRANMTMHKIPHVKTDAERDSLIRAVSTDIAQISNQALKTAASKRFEAEKNKKSAVVAAAATPYTPPAPSAPPASADDAIVAVITNDIEKIRNLPKTLEALASPVAAIQVLIRQAPEAVRSELRKKLETAIGNQDLYNAEDDEPGRQFVF